MLERCLAALKQQRGVIPQIVVVDCGSTDGSPEMVSRKYPDVVLIRRKRIGIGEALNIGIEHAESDVIVLDLNNDDIVDPNWLRYLVSTLRDNSEVGVAGGKRYRGEPGSKVIDAIGGKVCLLTGRTTRIGANRYDSSAYDTTKNIDYTGVIATRKDVIDAAGPFDPTYYLYFEDTDFCFRVKLLGYKVTYVPQAKHWHLGSSTIGLASQRYVYYMRRGRIRFILKLLPAPWFVIPVLWTLIVRTFIDALACFPPITILLSRTRLAFIARQSGKKNFRAILSAIAWNLRNLRETFRARAEFQACLDKKQTYTTS